MKCPKCKTQLSKNVKLCPACGTRVKKKTGRRIVSVLLLVVLLLSIVAILAKNYMQGSKEAQKLDVEQIEKTLEHFEGVKQSTDSIVEVYLNEEGYVTCEMQLTVLEKIAEHAKTLYQDGEITNYAFREGDTCVYMEVDGWLSVLYTPPIKEFMSEGTGKFEIITLEPNATEMYINYLTSGGKGPDEAAQRLAETIDWLSYTGDFENSQVSIESFTRLPQNSIIIFNGHGGFNAKIGSVLFTGIDAWDEQTLQHYSDGLASRAIGINQDGEFYLTSIFFDEYISENAYAGNIFYLGACNTCSDPRLAQSIWDKGARAVIGNTQIVWINYNFQMMYSFFEGLTTKDSSGKYLSISKALEYAKNKNGDKDPYIFGYGSEVRACYRDDFTLPDLVNSSDFENTLIVKATEPTTSGAYEAYIAAVKKTTASGKWTENLNMTADMAISNDSAKIKTTITMTSDADVSNYSESDPSKVCMSGSAEMIVMGQTYAWNMQYKNGIAYYQYAKPNQTSADMAIDPNFFNFGTMTSDMMSDAKLSGNTIAFTAPGDKITEVGIAAVNQMSGVEDLEYGDVNVTVTISVEGKIDTITMTFHASMEYQGYDADVAYEILYSFYN